jgi:hypothetical protein
MRAEGGGRASRNLRLCILIGFIQLLSTPADPGFVLTPVRCSRTYVTYVRSAPVLVKASLETRLGGRAAVGMRRVVSAAV